MTGIILLLVVGGWLWACVAMTRGLLRRWQGRPWGLPVAYAAFVALLIAPLGDEIIGKFQFNSLCAKYAVDVVDEAHALNRRVLSERRAVDRYASGTAVRIQIDPYTYRDEETKGVLASFHILTARGGWLVRMLGISETSAPLLFSSGCAPPNAFGFLKKFNMTVVN